MRGISAFSWLHRPTTALAAAVIAAGVLAFAGAASAGLIVTAGVDNTGTTNVIANGCGAGVAIPGPATTVAGCFNTAHGVRVQFDAHEAVTYSGGQATLDAAGADGVFSYFKVSVSIPASTFTKLIVNVDGTANGVLRFSDGANVVDVALDQNGQNFYISTDGPFGYIEVTSGTGTGAFFVEAQLIADVKQVRIGGVSQVGCTPTPGGPPCVNVPDDIPEPASLALLGFGLLGLGLVTRRRFR